MRIIQYFLIGLFLSFCTIPVYASCLAGFAENDNSVCESIGFIDLGSGPEKIYLPPGSYGIFSIELLPLMDYYRSWGYGLPVIDTWDDYVSYRFDGTRFFYEWNTLGIIEGTDVSYIPVGDGSPQALFNIDGIKDNILATLLAIVGVLLMLVAFKYAWSTVKLFFVGGPGHYSFSERQFMKSAAYKKVYPD